jgi:phosphoenolpyruvate---glycerone phosphotransferase subunit DhaL
MTVKKEEVLCWLAALARVFAENRQQLTDLDLAIGDADHGINMDRGFEAVVAELSAHPPADLRSAFQNVATVLIRTVGGAAGPLYGTFFLRAAAACTGKSQLDSAGVVALFEAGVAGVQQRGKAVPGDKTMLDALIPALESMRRACQAGNGVREILAQGATAAQAGMLATIPMQARKGRASYLGPRSIGHQDPGATSSYLLLKTAAETWRP